MNPKTMTDEGLIGRLVYLVLINDQYEYKTIYEEILRRMSARAEERK